MPRPKLPKKEHWRIIYQVRNKLSSKYIVTIGRRENWLPSQEEHLYEPDVIARNKNGEIVYLIEVETDPMRKSVVGASILADYCLGVLKQRRKPNLYFILGQKGLSQISHHRKRLKAIRPYLNNIQPPHIDTRDKVFQWLK